MSDSIFSEYSHNSLGDVYQANMGTFIMDNFSRMEAFYLNDVDLNGYTHRYIEEVEKARREFRKAHRQRLKTLKLKDFKGLILPKEGLCWLQWTNFSKWHDIGIEDGLRNWNDGSDEEIPFENRILELEITDLEYELDNWDTEILSVFHKEFTILDEDNLHLYDNYKLRLERNNKEKKEILTKLKASVK